MLPDLSQLEILVSQIAEEELLPRFRVAEKSIKPDGSIVTEADIAMQERLGEALAERYPQYPLLGEETPEQEQQALLAAPETALWCLDPLDGTSNFAAGIPFFSVSLALLVEKQPVLGLVYDPIRRECFSAQKGRGAHLNRNKLETRTIDLPLERCIGVIDFKRLAPTLANKLAQHPPYSSQRSFGSVALDWCWLAANRYHVYLHGKQKVWDYAAGTLILEEAGGRSSTLDGKPVFNSQLQPSSALAALDAQLFDQWQAWLLSQGGDAE